MLIGSVFQIYPFDFKPSAPATGTFLLYAKTDNTIYLQDDLGNEYAFASVGFISSLTGDVSATGPGAAAATVNSVGGYTAAQIATAVAAVNAATAANTPSTIVLRDASGNFSAGTITAALTGAASANVLKAGDTMTGPLNINSAAANALIVDTDVLVVDGALNRVGINKVNPTEALEVVGNIKASGTVTGTNISGTNTGDVTVTDTTTIDLTLSGQALTADVKPSSLTNTEISSSAAIARSKLASGSANRVAVNDGSGVLSDAAAITAARALISDANGIPTHSTTTATELGYVGGATSSIQTQLNNKQQVVQNLVIVQKTPGLNEYSTIEAALTYVASQTPSSSNRFLIKVGPGEYTENLLDLSSLPGVSITGDAIQIPVIKPAGNHHIFKLGVLNEISFMWLEGATTGYAGIAVLDSGDYSQVHKITFNDCNIGILLEATTQDTLFYGEYIDFNGAYSYGVKGTASSGATLYCSLENYWTVPGSAVPATIGTHFSGPDCQVVLNGGNHTGVSNTGTGIYIEDGVDIEITAFTIESAATGLTAANVGAACIVKLMATSFRNNTQDLNIAHASTTGSFSGVSQHSKIANSSVAFQWLFLDVADGDLEIRNRLAVTYDDGTNTDLMTLLQSSSTLGLLEGGQLTAGVGLQVSVAAGLGYAENTATEVYKKFSFSSANLSVPANAESFIFINISGTLTYGTALPDLVQNIYLGRVVTDGSGLIVIDSAPMNAEHTQNSEELLFREAVGALYVDGSATTENVTPFHLDVTGGNYYLSTNKFSPVGGVDIDFDFFYHNGSSAWVITNTNLVDNTHYNNGNTFSLLSTGYYTKHTLYVSGDSVNEKYFLVLGQEEFSTLLLAEQAALPIPPDYFYGTITPIASVIIQEGAAAIIEVLDIRPVLGFKSTGTIASSDHQSLSNRAALTAHSQYLLKANTDAMGINLDMGTYSITNVNLVDGVDVSAHASRHLPAGADALTTAAAVTLDATTTNAEGIANSFARSDHTHDISTGVVSSQTPDQSNAEGSSANLARADHTHNIPATAPTTTLDPTTTNAEGVAASFARGDHTHAIATGLTADITTILPDDSASAGTADKYARADHKHAIAAATAGTLLPDQSNAEGVSTSFARADHIHNIPSGSVSTIGTANSSGSAASFALSDHVHAHGNQTSPTLHAAATGTDNGFMSSTDKTKLDAATSSNTPSTLVLRDVSGNFSAGTITADLTGTASSATNFLGSLVGDVTGTQGATVVSTVGGKTATEVATSVDDTQAATNVNTVSTIVKRDGNGDIAIRDLTVRKITASGALYTGVVALTDAATINLDASLGNIFTVTLGGNRTLAAPTNPIEGQKITIRVRQDGSGGRTLTFDSAYNFGADLAGLTLTTTANAYDYLGMQYNSTTSKWDVLAISRNY